MSSDYQLEDTIYLPFTTRAFATGIPTVLAGTPAIDIYEDASATQVVTGETLAVSLDSVVGFNMITITATAGTGFEAGKSYTAIIQAGTVGGVSVVGEVVGHFTLDMSAAAKDLANGTDGLGALKTVVDAGATAASLPTAQTDLDTLTGADGATLATAQGNYAPSKAGDAMTLTAAATSAQLVDDIWDEDVDTSHQTAGTAGKKLDDAGAAADPWATALPGAYGAGTAGKIIGDNIDAPISTVDTVVDAIKAVTDLLPDAGALDDLATILIDTNELQTDWTNGGRLDLLIDAIKVVTDSLTDLATVVDAVWDEAHSGHTSAGTFGKDILQIKEATVSVESTVNDAGASTTNFITALTEATDDHYIDVSLVFIDGILVGQSRPILSYNGTTKTVTMDEGFTEAPGDGDAFIIRTDHVHPVSQIADGVLDEALAGHTTAGTLGKAMADIEVDTSTTLDDHLTDIKGTAFVKDTHSLIDIEGYVDILDDGTSGNAKIATDAAAILVDTNSLNDTKIPDTISLAAINAEVDTALTDYDSPTNAEMEARTPTAAQLLYMTRHASTAQPIVFTTAGGSTTAAVLNTVDGSAASTTNDVYNSRIILFTSGTLLNQVTDITDYVGATKTAIITAITTAPTSSHTALLL